MEHGHSFGTSKQDKLDYQCRIEGVLHRNMIKYKRKFQKSACVWSGNHGVAKPHLQKCLNEQNHQNFHQRLDAPAQERHPASYAFHRVQG